jgi:putative SOS response-associated peptidase YedK
MCGRFSLGLAHREVRSSLGHNIESYEWIGEESFFPRHNIAPKSQAPVLMQRSDSTSSVNNDQSLNLVLRTMKWGLVPSWSKHEDKTLNTINARSENLVEGGGMWGSIKGKKRCVVLCEGYFEWLKRDRERIPYFIKHKDGEKGQLMLLAGLYDCTFLEGSTEPLWTFTIVTAPACNDLTWLHDRQPVILSSREALEIWLDTSAQTWTPALTKLVESYDNSLEWYQVPKEVGKVGTESPTFIEPIANRKDGIQAMFLRQKQVQTSRVREPPKRKRSSSSSPSRPAVEPNDLAKAGQPLSKKSTGDADVTELDAPPTLAPKTKNPRIRSPPAARNSTAPSGGKNPSSKTKNTKGASSTTQITHFFSKT